MSTFRLDIENGSISSRSVTEIEVVGHRSSGPIGTQRLALGEHDAVVLTLTDAQALRLVMDLTRRLELRAAKREEGI